MTIVDNDGDTLEVEPADSISGNGVYIGCTSAAGRGFGSAVILDIDQACQLRAELTRLIDAAQPATDPDTAMRPRLG